VEVLSDEPTRFAPGSRLLAGNPEAGEMRELEVSACRTGREWLLVCFEGVASREAAQAIQGTDLLVPLETARALAEGEFWDFQLVGLEVVGQAGETLGRVSEVLDYPASTMLVVRTIGGDEVMVPSVPELISEVDLEKGRVVVRAIPGLFNPSDAEEG